MATAAVLMGLSVAAAVMVPGVHAQRFPQVSKDVEVVGVLPKNPGNLVNAGELLHVVAAFVNMGDGPFNVSGIMGSMNNPLDFSQVFSNLTGQGIGEIVEAGAERAFDYVLEAPPVTEMRDVQIALIIFFEDAAGRPYAHTYFNQSVTVLPEAKGLTVKSVLPYLLALGATGMSVWLLWDILGPMLLPTAVKAKRAAATANARDKDDDDRYDVVAHREAPSKRSKPPTTPTHAPATAPTSAKASSKK